MKKKSIFIWGAIVVLAVALFFIFSSGENTVSGQKIAMYKSPTCGCCVGNAGILKKDGFDVKTIESESKLDQVKSQNGIPLNMRSCHTSIIGGYFVEGHVPTEAIEKLLAEMPDIDGIALPGMPSGSPGMPGPKREDFVIHSIKDGKVIGEFMRI